jgi:hypothetical protein
MLDDVIWSEGICDITQRRARVSLIVLAAVLAVLGFLLLLWVVGSSQGELGKVALCAHRQNEKASAGQR